MEESKQVKMRAKISFGPYSPGQILDPDLGVADVWYSRGFAEPIDPDDVRHLSARPESAMVEPQAERAILDSARGRKVKH